MRIIEIPERGDHYFLRSDLIDPYGRSLVLESTRAMSVVEIKDVEDGCKLLTLGSIGYLPLTATITLNIIPKFPVQNLWAMLEGGGEDYRSILPILRLYQASEEAAPSNLLLRSFCFYLKEALVLGLPRSYSPKYREGFYQPKLDFGATVNRFLARGDPLNVASNSFEFGLTSAVNAVVKSACIQVSKLLPLGEPWKAERALIQDALKNLAFVDPKPPTISDFDLGLTVPLRVRPAYLGMLLTYKLLLTGGGVSFAYERGGRELPSFLFNLEAIFENFIRRTFQAMLREHKINVVDGNRNPGSLFINNRDYPTKSDLFFCRAKKNVIAVGEVKYKPKIKETDRYQLISHVIAAKAQLGIIFSPANPGEEQRLQLLGKISTGADFYHYRLSIDGDIKKNAEKMVKDISGLLLPLAS